MRGVDLGGFGLPLVLLWLVLVVLLGYAWHRVVTVPQLNRRRTRAAMQSCRMFWVLVILFSLCLRRDRPGRGLVPVKPA